MANNFRQFSEKMKTKPKAKVWIDSFLTRFNWRSEPTSAWDRWCDEHRLGQLEADPDNWPGFSHAWTSRNELWLYAEEHAYFDNVQIFIQKYLQRFEPKGVFSLTYSETCSKLREGEFGGGGMVITASNVFWMSGHHFVEKKLAELKAKRQASTNGPGKKPGNKRSAK